MATGGGEENINGDIVEDGEGFLRAEREDPMRASRGAKNGHWLWNEPWDSKTLAFSVLYFFFNVSMRFLHWTSVR